MGGRLRDSSIREEIDDLILGWSVPNRLVRWSVGWSVTLKGQAVFVPGQGVPSSVGQSVGRYPIGQSVGR